MTICVHKPHAKYYLGVSHEKLIAKTRAKKQNTSPIPSLPPFLSVDLQWLESRDAAPTGSLQPYVAETIHVSRERRQCDTIRSQTEGGRQAAPLSPACTQRASASLNVLSRSITPLSSFINFNSVSNSICSSIILLL